MSSVSNQAPGQLFNLSAWKLQLPVDTAGSFLGNATEIKNLSSYVNQAYFFTGSDGAMVFKAPVNGATTGGSDYARSELREMEGSTPAEWTLKEGGHLAATLEVDAAPTKAGGTPGKIVIGQIHGGDSQLVRLAWDNGKIYFANDVDASGNKDLHVKLLDAAGNEPSVSLNERFSYTIDVKDHTLTVSVFADGKVYTSSTTVNAAWDDNKFYFKAGAYLGVNEGTGSGYGQTSFFALNFDHKGDSPVSTLVTGSVAGSTDAAAFGGISQSLRPETTNTITGTDRADTLIGKSTNDLIVGGSGDDSLNGSYGRDVLTGGAGRDIFVFNRNPDTLQNSDTITDFKLGEDKIGLDDSKFKMLKDFGFSAKNFVLSDHGVDADDFIYYNQKTGGLYYDRDGSGSYGAEQIALIENQVKLSFNDFLLV